MILGPQVGKGHLGASPGFMLCPLEKPWAGGSGEAQALFHPLPNSHSASLEVLAADSAGGVSGYVSNMSESVLLS